MAVAALTVAERDPTLLLQVAAMDVESLPATSPEMAALLTEMGTAYDPERLAQALQNRRAEVSARAIRVTATLGAFLARLAKVGGQVVCIFSSASVLCTGTANPVSWG